MHKMQNLNFLKTMLDITTKIQHKVGFVITHSIAALNPSGLKFIFGGKLYRKFSSGQIGYCAIMLAFTYIMP